MSKKKTGGYVPLPKKKEDQEDRGYVPMPQPPNKPAQPAPEPEKK